MSGQVISLATKGILCCPSERIQKIVTPINVNIEENKPKYSLNISNNKYNVNFSNLIINLKIRKENLSLRVKNKDINIKNCKEL